MRLPKITRKLAWLPVLVGLLLCGTAYRVLAAGGANGTATSTSNNLRQPVADTNGLVAWYPLDGDATDYGGNHNGGTATAYVNGVQQLTAASAFAFSGVPANVGGKFLGTARGTFNGSIDDFRVYSRILAPEEVADQWRQGT